MATSTIKPKKGTTAQWAASGRVLEVNEWGVEVTENGHHILRIGDGEHLFHELPAVFDAENYEELMAQAVYATNAANTAAENADTARDNADAAAAAALTAANTASIAAQANTNAVIETVSGAIVTMNDSSDLALTGLKLFGKTTQDGEPSPENPVPLVSVGDGGSVGVTVCGKNLFDIKKRLSGTVLDSGDLQLGGVKEFYRGVFKENTQYTISAYVKNTNTSGSVRFAVQYTDGAYDNYIMVNNTTEYAFRKYTSVAGKTIEYIGTYFGSSGTLLVKNCELQIEEGTTATAYEPYVSGGSLTVQTPNGLPGIPVTSGGNYTDANGQQWVCDEVDFARGVYVQRVGNEEFDGSDDETWKAFDSLGNGIFRVTMLSAFVANAEPPIMSNFGYKGTVLGDSALSGVANGVWSYYNSSVGMTTRSVYIKLGADVLLEEWKEELAKTPFRVINILATPIETPLSAEEIAAFKALHSNKPNTTVYNDSGAHMAVEYIADTKTYIDNKFAELQNAILSAGANI